MLDDVIGGPRECLRVDSLEAWTLKAMAIRAGLGLRTQLTRSSTTLPAHVSDGRWVVDCPCGSAGLASHEWGVGICVDCGTIHAVAFPVQRKAVEETLLARPNPANRHFLPADAHRHRLTVRAAGRGESLDEAQRREDAAAAMVGGEPVRGETLASIRRENREHGHPEKRGEA